MNPDNKLNEKPQAIKYVGLYKPSRPYSVGNGFLILPAGAEMVEYSFGAGKRSTRQNISYFVTENEISSKELVAQYREWLAFDAFILDDDSPIRAFDMQIIGHPETMPSIVPDGSPSIEYFEPDYDNISSIMFKCAPDAPGLPEVSYSDIYQRYRALPIKRKELIEWFVSFPAYLSQDFCRKGAFFNPGYWTVLHMATLIDQLVGVPESCPQSPKQCACGYNNVPSHYKMPRREWLRQFLASRISSPEISEDYARIIETAYDIRHPMAHGPNFDRSEHNAPLTHPEVYDACRAAIDYKHDSAALKSLNLSLHDVVRHLLLTDVFGIKFFQPLRKLTSFPVKN